MNLAVQALPHVYAGNSVRKQKNLQKNEQPVAGTQTSTNVMKLINNNYGQLLINKPKVSFGDYLPAIATPALPPLEKRIGAAMTNLGKNDIILAAPNTTIAKKALQNSIGSIDTVVRRIQLIEDKSLRGAFFINKNDIDMFEIVNLDAKPISIDSHGQKIELKQGKAAFLAEQDLITVGSKKFELVPDERATSDLLPLFGVKTYDFSKKDLKAISNLNLRHLEELGIIETKTGTKKKLTFADVGGQDEAISDLKKAIIYPLKFPMAYKNNILNRGVILTGGPGTGKTLLAEALANETDAYFMKLNGLEMESKWVGASEENWRNLFQEAKDNQPSIIFIDEFDAVAKNREGSDTSRHDDKVVNQLLTLMSDLEKGKDDVFVIVATNKIDLLDPAIMRSGRFGKHIPVGNPNLEGCEKILDIHTKPLPVKEGFDKETFAQKLHELNVSGADIAHISNEANQKMFERTGVFEKMENDTFSEDDIESLKIEQQDFDKALEEWKTQSKSQEKPKRRIGFIQEPLTV